MCRLPRGPRKQLEPLRRSDLGHQQSAGDLLHEAACTARPGASRSPHSPQKRCDIDKLLRALHKHQQTPQYASTPPAPLCLGTSPAQPARLPCRQEPGPPHTVCDTLANRNQASPYIHLRFGSPSGISKPRAAAKSAAPGAGLIKVITNPGTPHTQRPEPPAAPAGRHKVQPKPQTMPAASQGPSTTNACQLKQAAAATDLPNWHAAPRSAASRAAQHAFKAAFCPFRHSPLFLPADARQLSR